MTEDQEAQERVCGQLQTWQRNPDTIRRLLTHTLIPATDRKALFVGLAHPIQRSEDWSAL